MRKAIWNHHIDDLKLDIKERIHRLLVEHNWTPYRLAKESGLSDATVGNLFRRNTVPSIATLEAICNGFGITLAQFFTEGEVVELTPELKELFEDWVDLTVEQKQAIKYTMKAMKRG